MVLTALHRTVLAVTLAGFCVVPAPLLFASLVPGFAIQAVLADDDDDGGDDDDDDYGDDDDDDGPVFSPPAPRIQPASAIVLPEAAANEIVAYGLSSASVAQLLEAGYVLQADDELSELGLLVRLQVPAGRSIADALAQVALLEPDATVAPNSYYYNQAEPAPCNAAICQLWPMVGWPDMSAGQCAATPLIGVVDTGVNVEHEVLKGADLVVERFIETTDAPSGAKHGTAVVAMLVGGATSQVPGLLPNAQVRVADPFAALDGGSERADTYALTRAIVHLLALEVDVINLSLAGSDNPVLAGVVALADTKGIPLVAAVGNAGARSQPLYPAAYGSVLAVTAIDTQKRVYRRAVQGAHVDIAAPGVDIPTAASISGMRPQTGTSFAAPFVTAALAARLAAQPESSPGTVVEELTAAAEDLGTAGRDEIFGWGLLRSDVSCGPRAARPG